MLPSTVRMRHHSRSSGPNYYLKEKEVYEQLLTEPVEVVTGTVEELAKKYGIETPLMLGFLDGINESIKEPNPIEDLEADSTVTLDIDLEKLYYNMVAARADWLYNLPPVEQPVK